jgi:hypothetical protein
VGRRLYGQLLTVFPGLEALDGSWDARTTSGERLRFEVTGRRGSFRRIELVQFEEDEIGDLVCAPRLELMVSIDTQCVKIAQYENALLCQNSFAASPIDSAEQAPRLVIAFVTEFLSSLSGTNIFLSSDSRFRSGR